jgi:hypothetical protein
MRAFAASSSVAYMRITPVQRSLACPPAASTINVVMGEITTAPDWITPKN